MSDLNIKIHAIDEDLDKECAFLERFRDEELIKIIRETKTDRCKQLFSHGSMMPRGYFYPNPLAEHYIGKLKRGKLTVDRKRTVFEDDLNHEYYFDEKNQLIRINLMSSEKDPERRIIRESEFILYYDDHSVGMNFDLSEKEKLRQITYSRFDSKNRTTDFIICDCWLDGACSRIRKEKNVFRDDRIVETDFLEKSYMFGKTTRAEFRTYSINQDGKYTNIHTKRIHGKPDDDSSELLKLFAKQLDLGIPSNEIGATLNEGDISCDFKPKTCLASRYQDEVVSKVYRKSNKDKNKHSDLR